MGTVVKVGLGIVFGVFLLIAGCAAIIGLAGSGSGGGESQVEEGGSGGGGGSGKPKAADVGDKLTLKGTTYQVTSAKSASTVGDDEFTKTKANGEFIVVKLKLTNRKDESATIAEDAIKVFGAVPRPGGIEN